MHVCVIVADELSITDEGMQEEARRHQALEGVSLRPNLLECELLGILRMLNNRFHRLVFICLNLRADSSQNKR